MRLRQLVLTLTAGLLVSCTPEPPVRDPEPLPATRVEEKSAFEIPFERYQLDNGLTVILHRDPSDPIVAMATIAHVGSAREKPGRTGFAHFFEHMSFNDSENVPMGANRKMIPELGGTRNGGTWDDGTIYYEVVPKDAFEKLMWIDSDRLGYMINTVKEGTLEREKQVVKNEKRQRVDNRAYGHTDHIIRKALYRKDHPYNWTVIGDLEDLQAATLEDVRQFYAKYYVPGNATLVIAGDIDIEQTKSMVQTWFGEIESGQVWPDLDPQPATLEQSRSLFHLDNFAQVPELTITFPTVEETHPDRWALDALGTILADGKQAPLYDSVVNQAKLSTDVWAYHSPSELAGTFTVRVRANPSVDLDAVKKAIDAGFAAFEEKGFRDIDLERTKASAKLDFFSGIESSLDRALQLGIYQEFWGGAEAMFEVPKKVQAVTREDVMRVYETYIAGKPSITTSFVPKDHPNLVVMGSTQAEIVEEEIVSGAEKEFTESDAEDYPRTKTKHDRSEPPLGPRPKLRAPEIWRATAANDMTLVGIEHTELPIVEFSLRIDGGQMLDPADKTGVARLMAELLNEGTANKTPQELEDAIDLLGGDLRVWASESSVNVRGRVLTDDYGPIMALVEEMLLEPRWDAAEFERLKTRRLAAIAQRDGNPPAIANLVFSRLLYGDQHIGGQPFGGTAQTVEAITLDDCKAWYAANMSPGNAVLHVAGDIDPATAQAGVASLTTRWTGDAVAMPELPEPPGQASKRPHFVDVPGAKQSVIVVGDFGPRGDDPTFYKTTVVMDRLGSGSSARLTQTLRIEKGFSYGAYAGFSREPFEGPFVASAQVRSNATAESLKIFHDLIGNYRKTFTQQDLDVTVNRLSKADTRRFETLSQLLGVLTTMTQFDLPDDYIERQREELLGLKLEDAHALIDEHLNEDQMIYVIVGDAKTQRRGVRKLGRGRPIMLDRKGNPARGR